MLRAFYATQMTGGLRQPDHVIYRVGAANRAIERRVVVSLD